MVKRNLSSYKESKFASHIPHSSSQLSVALVPGDSDILFCFSQAQGTHLGTYIHTTLIGVKIKNSKKENNTSLIEY